MEPVTALPLIRHGLQHHLLPFTGTDRVVHLPGDRIRHEFLSLSGVVP